MSARVSHKHFVILTLILVAQAKYFSSFRLWHMSVAKSARLLILVTKEQGKGDAQTAHSYIRWVYVLRKINTQLCTKCTVLYCHGECVTFFLLHFTFFLTTFSQITSSNLIHMCSKIFNPFKNLQTCFTFRPFIFFYF
jgi:succinate-acetate transporter protein